MQTRRDFIHGAAGAAATAVAFVGCDLLNAKHVHAEGAPRRREVVVSGKRVKTVDIHAHCAFPETHAMVGPKVAPAALDQTDERIRQMDAQGIDVEALSINPFWYKADRDLAEKLIRTAEREARRIVRDASRPLRRLRHGRHAVPRPCCAAARIRRQKARAARHVGRRPMSRARSSPIRSSTRSGRNAEELGILVFMHPTPFRPTRAAVPAAMAGSSMSSAIRSRPRSRSRT